MENPVTQSDPHPRRYLAPLITANHLWLDQTRAWFDKHPEREFKLTKLPIEAVQAVGLSGWLVGVASRPFLDPDNLGLEVVVGATSVPCIIKRPDPAGGQPNPAVFIMDGVGTMPPLPHAKNATPAQRARAEEKTAAGIWQFAAVASASGVPLIGALRMAATVQATHRKR
jgi:hypothetical protein